MGLSNRPVSGFFEFTKARTATIPSAVERLWRGNVRRPMEGSLVEVRNLVTTFTSGGQRVVAVDHVSLTVFPSTTLALVGESGCGKSVTGAQRSSTATLTARNDRSR